MPSTRLIMLAAFVAAVMAGAPARAQIPPSDLNEYVLFGSEKLAGKNVLITGGAVGSENSVVLQDPSMFSSEIVGSLVRLNNGSFGFVYSRALLGVDSVADLARWFPIVDGQSFRDPLNLIPDIGAACNFPTPPTCSGPSIVIPQGITLTLPAGVYGDLKIQGGLDPVSQQPMPGGVILPGGTYTFCNLQVASRGTVLVQSTTDIRIAGNLKLARGAYLGPASTSTITSSAIGVFVGGTRVKFGGSSTVLARTCAPFAKCGVGGGAHAGGLWCDALRVRNARFSPVSAPGCTVACDDGNDCTQDVCSGTQCLNIPQNGTACLVGGVTPGVCTNGNCLSTPTTSIPAPTTTSTTSSTSTSVTTTTSVTSSTTSTSTSSSTIAPVTTTSTTSSSSTIAPVTTTSTTLAGTTTSTTLVPVTTTSTTLAPGTTTSTTLAPVTTTSTTLAGTTTSTTLAPVTTTSTTLAPGTTTSTTVAPGTTTSTTVAPGTTTSTTVAPGTTTSTTLAPGTTTSTTAPPATTTSTTAPPATTTSTTAPPATTTSTTAPPATTTSTTAPPATTTSTTAPPATTTSTTAPPATTTSTTAPPATTTSTTAPPASTTSTTTAPPTTTSTTLQSPSGAFLD